MHELKKYIRQLSQTAPLSSYHYSTQSVVKEIKRIYDLDDKTLCMILKDMYDNGEIRDFGIRYSEWNPEYVDFYWFK